ncbi:AAA family ATPase [Bacillus cereus group sp. BcHK140]|uniref:AAA family ATPase n=1 Tax=Bacillus cereus group sp. BcHK140 TaxID=3018092 RepID=UPI0022DF9253|nr:AAA family ATPase [Bacillus cereus group sp. BcHK140]MDA1919820.1 AAA family ATPase [Bacillus cereus group sp. BcHK140]
MKVNQLGPINFGEIKLAPLTILSGANNQGKTYFSYTLYGILKQLPNLMKGFFSDKDYNSFREFGKISFNKDVFTSKIINAISRNLEEEKGKILEMIFKSESNAFDNTNIEISNEEIYNFLRLDEIGNNSIKIANTEILLEVLDGNYTILVTNNELEKFISIQRVKNFVDILISNAINKNINAFYIPAERIGINVFRGQLNSNKIEMLDIISNSLINDKKFNNFELDQKLIKGLKQISTVYPKPIEDYLEFINDISTYDIDDKNNELAAFIRRKIIKGRFVVDSTKDKSFYRLQIGKNRYKSEMIPLHITSSSIKSIYGLDYFFENINYDKQNTLIIDEPEMNLHPSNQLEFANLLNLIISKGINTIISTHSDFLVRKIQNIILQNDIDGNLEGLTPDNVKVYNFENATIKHIDLLNENESYNNFNDIIADIEDEYLNLLEKRAQKDDLGES